MPSRTMLTRITLAMTAMSISCVARDVPPNVRTFYNSVMSGSCNGTNLLQGGFYNTESSSTTWTYCQQNVAGKAVFIKGNGMFANMDIDCDGTQISNDIRCASSTDTQGQTTFRKTVQSYGPSDLDARIHSYVVFGNQGNYTPTFDPSQYGIHLLSVMAVVCGDKLVYGVWGDTNGDDGPPLVGEASLALATLCYGDSITGNNGHDENDVLYIAFTGQEAVPGKDGALWNSTWPDDFENSLVAIGDTLITRLGSNISSVSNGKETGNATNSATALSSFTSTIMAGLMIVILLATDELLDEFLA